MQDVHHVPHTLYRVFPEKHRQLISCFPVPRLHGSSRTFCLLVLQLAVWFAPWSSVYLRTLIVPKNFKKLHAPSLPLHKKPLFILLLVPHRFRFGTQSDACNSGTLNGRQCRLILIWIWRYVRGACQQMEALCAWLKHTNFFPFLCEVI